VLDIATIFFCTFISVLVAAVAMTAVWCHDRRQRAAGWWAISFYVGALAGLATALRSVIPDYIEVQVAICNLLEVIAYGLVWAGVRAFNDQPVSWKFLVAVPGVWLTAFVLWEPFRTDINVVVIIQTAVTVGFALLVAHTLHSGPGNRQLPVMPVVVAMLLTHALARLFIIPCAIFLPATLINGQAEAVWFGPYMVELMVHTIATAISFVVLIKDRSEQRHRIASETDDMTGIANRRAFMDATETALAGDGEWSLAILDLDFFKTINDENGHQTGDRILMAFAETVKTVIPPEATFGRIGGEEFALLLHDTDATIAPLVLERVRLAVEQISVSHRGVPIRLTTSIGTASTRMLGRDLDRLIGAADEAVYRAKAAGRNRVEIFRTSQRLAGVLGAANARGNWAAARAG
jgi:diguanylate cyclase (GGDEF)-like protein